MKIKLGGTQAEKQFICDKLAENYADLLKYATYKLGGDEGAADGCIQDMLLIALDNARLVSRHKNIEGWFFKTLNNMIKRCFKAQNSKYSFIDIENAISLLPYELPSFDEPDMSDADIKRIKDDCLSELSESELELYSLFYVEKKTSKEIAEKLNVSDQAVRMRLSRLREKLRTIIAQKLSSGM